MKKSKVEVVAHSRGPNGDELISVLCTFPRIVLAEVNTHRMLSKNTSSSRAIPFWKAVKSVTDNTFIPYAFQGHHSGMQGHKYLDPNKKVSWEEVQPVIHSMITKNFSLEDGDWAEVEFAMNEYVWPLFRQDEQGRTPAEWWIQVRNIVIGCAIMVYAMGVTKQIANRLLEPFMWVTDIITGNKQSFEGFFKLRCPDYVFHDVEEFHFRSRKDMLKQFGPNEEVEYENHPNVFLSNLTEEQWLEADYSLAEIHIQDLAENLWDTINESTPRDLEAGEWHIPFRDKIENTMNGRLFQAHENFDSIKIKISTAMAARTSYTVVDEEKEISYQSLIDVYETKLIGQEPPHSSPFEHCAKVMSDDEHYEFRRGKLFEDSDTGLLLATHGTEGWCNNFQGFIQLRYFIDNNLKPF
jgi:hypothetical protein